MHPSTPTSRCTSSKNVTIRSKASLETPPRVSSVHGPFQRAGVVLPPLAPEPPWPPAPPVPRLVREPPPLPPEPALLTFFCAPLVVPFVAPFGTPPIATTAHTPSTP